MALQYFSYRPHIRSTNDGLNQVRILLTCVKVLDLHNFQHSSRDVTKAIALSLVDNITKYFVFLIVSKTIENWTHRQNSDLTISENLFKISFCGIKGLFLSPDRAFTTPSSFLPSCSFSSSSCFSFSETDSSSFMFCLINCFCSSSNVTWKMNTLNQHPI